MVGIVTVNGFKKKKYTTDHCLNCKFKSECTSQYKRIINDPYNPVIEEIRRFYYSEKGQEIYYLKGHYAETSSRILIGSRNFRGIKTKGLEKVNLELTLHEIHHNIKKFEKLTNNTFLKSILKEVKKYKKENGHTDFIVIENLRKNFIIENDVIIGINKGKKKTKRK